MRVSPFMISADVTWRRVGPSMWTAERRGDLIATIELVRVYVVTSPCGDVIGTSTDFDEARRAVESPVGFLAGAPCGRRSRRGTWRARSGARLLPLGLFDRFRTA